MMFYLNTLKTIYHRLKIANPLVNKYKLRTYGNLNPYFIIGAGRSGNTLLRRILNNHSAYFIPPETFVLGSIIRKFQLYNHLDWKFLVEIVYSEFELNHEFETFGIESLIELKKEMINLPLNKRSLDILLNEFYLFYAKKHNISKLKWGDKTPLNTFAIKELRKVFPNAYFIHIIRNPYDSIYSYINSGIYKNYNDATLRWTKSVTLARKHNAKSKKYVEIYYEDLVTQTEKEVQRICYFLNINYEHNMLEPSNQFLGDVDIRKHHKNVNKPINEKSIGKGIRNIPDEKMKLIKSILIKNSNKYIEEILNRYNINE